MLSWKEALNKCKSLNASLPFIKSPDDIVSAPTLDRYKYLLQLQMFDITDFYFIGLKSMASKKCPYTIN